MGILAPQLLARVIFGRRWSMQLNRVRVSEQADNALRSLKARTGLTPNLLCRIGFCLSLREPIPPDLNDYDQNGREFNRYTLTGQYDSYFLALLKQYCYKHNRQDQIEEQFVANLNRGVLLLFQRVKGITDIPRLINDINKKA